LALACALAASAATAGATPGTSEDEVRKAEALLAGYAPDKPGVAVLVTRGGQTVFEAYRGAADLEHGQSIGPQTRFHIASVSKQFTGFALASLAAEGKVDLEAGIRTYLPDMPAFGHKVTLSDLLHHTSGLRDQWGLFLLSGSTLQDLLKQRTIVAIAERQRALNFEPGTDYEYSNTGFTLAAQIDERASGMSLRRLLEVRLFRPLGMSGTFVYDDVGE